MEPAGPLDNYRSQRGAHKKISPGATMQRGIPHPPELHLRFDSQHCHSQNFSSALLGLIDGLSQHTIADAGYRVEIAPRHQFIGQPVNTLIFGCLFQSSVAWSSPGTPYSSG